MMNHLKLGMVALTIASASLAGCAGTAIPIPGVSVTLEAQLIADVQSATTAACSFVPTAITIANLVTADNGIVQTADGIASAICGAVTKAPAGAVTSLHRRATAPITVNGVTIHGYFVK